MRDFRRTVWAVVRQMAAGCVLLLAVRVGGAQDLRYLSQQAWSTEEGLPQSSVHSVTQTGDGYLWIGTEGGLVRFDGVSFRVFGKSTDTAFISDDICCLVAGADGLWVGTADGVVRRVDGGWRRYGVREGLPSATVVGMRVVGGSAVVETAGGFARWDGSRFERVAGGGGEVLAGADGAVWSYDRAGVSVVRGGMRRVWRTGVELPAGRVQTVYVDREGLAWVGMNDGLVVLDAKAAGGTPVAALKTNSVLSIFEDAEGNHWIGTETSGLHVLRRLRFRSEPGLADKAVTSVAQTADGAVWVGTREDGLRRVRGGGVDEPVKVNALASPVILCLEPGVGGGLWVGTPDGLNFVEARGVVRRIALGGGLPDETIRSLAADGEESVWAGTQHGLVHVGRDGVKTLTTAEGLGGDMVGSLLVDKRRGVLWAGTSGGVSRVGADGRIVNFTTSDGLGGEIATAMALDAAGGLWVATKGGGLSRFDGRRFVATGAVPMDAGIYGMRVDADGVMWLRMERGVGRVAVSALQDCVTKGGCAEGVVARYGLADGLPNDEMVAGGSPAEWMAGDGEMWFATRGGVAVADTKDWQFVSSAPPVVVERFLVDDVAERLGGEPVQIPFGHNRFTMEYAGLNFTAPTEVRYRFRLEALDKGWVDAGSRRSAFYTNLGPGWYRFVVEASNGDGVWSAPGAELRFRVVPPFYRRWWFVALMVLAAIGLLAGIYLVRLRLLRRQFDAVLAERNRMAREIHDTLTQDFVSTSLQLDLVAQQLQRGKVELAMEQVRRTRQMVTEGLNEARQSIWELRANSSQDSLPTRLTRLVQREAFAGIAPKLRVGGAYRVLDSRVEREVLRIAQEALANVVHHARATEAVVELQYASDTLLLMIGDNGAGFVVDEAVGKTGHYGLLGMRERAATIGGVLEMESEPGQGTRITLRVATAQSGG